MMHIESANEEADILRAAPLAISKENPFIVGANDLLAGVNAWRLWSMLGWNDILQRYRRSALGPFWITLSMTIFIVLLGVIYSRIFKMEIAVYLPYIAMGMITWGFISGSTMESCSTFTEGAGIIKQLRLPYSLYVFRAIWRNLIILFHTIVLIVPIALIFHVPVSKADFLVVPGLMLVFVNQIWVGIVVAVLTTRYRDVVQLVGTAIQIAMFATPIMWPVSSLGDSRIVADVNPLFHLIEIVRSPLLGVAPHRLSWAVVIVLCVIGYALALFLLWRGSRRIPYWL